MSDSGEPVTSEGAPLSNESPTPDVGGEEANSPLPTNDASSDASVGANPEQLSGDTSNEGVPTDELAEIDVPTAEQLVADLEAVTEERDNYLDSLRRLQAEFENYRKAVAKRESDARERANEGIVAELLPVLDACDGAVGNGAEDVEPIRKSLVEALTKQGLQRLDPAGEPFDPEQQEAVMHEPSEDGSGPVVAEVLRVGYQWKGRTLRPAMVKVRG